jgi:hypothetical protein
MKNETLDLIIENYKNQLRELTQLDHLTIEQESEKKNLIKALTDLVSARIHYETFYESN